MIVGFDGYFMGDPSSAWGATERSLLRELAELDSDDCFRVFVTHEGRAALPDLVNVQAIEVRPSKLHNALGRTRSLEAAIRSMRPAMDVYIETCEILPRVDPSITVASIEHDFSQGRLEYPLSLSRLSGIVYRRWHLRSVRRADILLCNSNFTLQQLKEYLRPGQATGVFPHGCDEAYRERGDGPGEPNGPSSPQELGRYFLFVGRVRVRHKRFELLLRAFDSLLSKNVDLKLVVVSSQAFTFGQRRLLRRFQDRVVLKQGLSPAAIARWYRHAVAVVLPSEYEGFGIPIIEAQNVGCPVIASNIPVFREVADGGAIYFEGTAADLAE